MSDSAASGAIDHQRSALVFGALADETRLGLVARLASGQRQSVSRLAGGSHLTRQAVTKHLRVLEKAGLVRNVKAGRESLFEFQPEPMRQASAWLDDVSARWDQALGRLRALVESGPEMSGEPR